MKPPKSITFLLLLLLLFITAQGIRLSRELIAEIPAVRVQMIRKERSSMENRVQGSSHARHALQCRGSSCSGSRRLLANTLTSTQLVSVESKAEKKGRQEVTPSDHDAPDIMDIAGMDYSSARKSTPNHN
ncbi:uncharacterized protein LOC116253412 [Nymphaea colorata]|nr:uncharacterized protein LOC116253412 [Nymphaea colorata]